MERKNPISIAKGHFDGSAFRCRRNISGAYMAAFSKPDPRARGMAASSVCQRRLSGKDALRKNSKSLETADHGNGRAKS